MSGPIRSGDLDFNLDRVRFAKEPRPQSEHRLLVYSSLKDEIQDTMVSAIRAQLQPGDVLVFNDSRVFPASLYRDDATFVLFIEPSRPGFTNVRVICPFKPSVGDEIVFPFAKVKLIAHEPGWDVYRADVSPCSQFGSLAEFLHVYGQIPLPIYLKRQPTKLDEVSLQNVFAFEGESIAPPVAGLHFTQNHIQELLADGIEIEMVTLHVGYGTFRSFKSEYIEQHVMDAESYSVNVRTLNALRSAKERGHAIVAVGTTVARVLETVWNKEPVDQDEGVLSGETSIFIYPPYEFRAIDGLITNFQYPRLPVLAMAAALVGIGSLRGVYDHAIRGDYMFYSYGDAMLLWRDR